MRAIFLDGDGTAFISEQRNRRAIERVAARGGFKIDPDTFWDIPGGDAGSGDERVWHMIVGKTFGFDAFKSTYPNTAVFQDAVDQEYLDSMHDLEVHQPVLDMTMTALRSGLIVSGASNARIGVFKANLVHTGYPVDQFHALIGKDDVIAAGRPIKPEADPFLMSMDLSNEKIGRMGGELLTPDQCIAVEDSGTGAKAGLAAGFLTIHLSHESGPLNPEEITDPSRYVYISPDDLMEFFLDVTARYRTQKHDSGRGYGVAGQAAVYAPK